MNFIKVGIYAAIIIAVLGFAKWAHSAIYDAGWNAAVVEQESAIAIAKDEAVKKARTEWEATAAVAETNIVIEERIVEVERVVEKKIPQIVERIVEIKPECNDLGVDFAGLLNEQVRSGSDRSDSGADIAAESDP